MSTAVTPDIQNIPTAENTASADIKRIFEAQQANKQAIKNTSAGERKKKLKAMEKLIMARKDDIRKAIHDDFRKPYAETDLTEIYPVLTELRHAIKEVNEWVKPNYVETPISYIGSSSKVIYEPKGTSLIIAPWNYPFNLCLIPLVSAIAAGNTAIMKPSEYTPNTSKLVKELCAELYPENEVAVVEGDHTVSSELLKLKFDHIFFTGSPQVGKIIMRAAAEHLTSVTLELGGKSPVVIDESASVSTAAKRITWGKFMNCGQTCVAPDYLLVHDSKYDKFMAALKEQIGKMYGESKEEQQATNDFARIVNAKHHARLKQLIADAVDNGANVETGGEVNDNENYISPTVLTNVSKESKVMEEEIFGPVLPILKYSDLNEALGIINQKEKPLALYIFSSKNKNINTILQNTTAGGTAINDTVVHVNHPNLPFGGINNSGLGNAHGFWGFKAFSHERAVMRQPNIFSAAEGMYPPYTSGKQKMVDLTLKYM